MTFENTLRRLESEVTALREEMGSMREIQAEHRVRLGNGTQVFSGWDKRIGAVEQIVAPKPPSIVKIVSVSLSVFLAAAFALWGLSEKLSDRPTMEQIHQVMGDHEDAGHKAATAERNEIIREQAVQQLQIKTVDEKIDTVLERLPASNNSSIRVRPPRNRGRER